MKCVRLFVFSASLAVLPASIFGQAYQATSVVNGGKITGTVKWSGPMPHIPSLPITKDPQICDPASTKTRDLERLIVGPQGGVANTVVFLKNISSGKAMEMPEPRRFLDQRHCRYEPHILLVPQGELLKMKNVRLVTAMPLIQKTSR